MAQLHALNESECRALLADRQVGRVAVMTPDGPHIVPVNYALVDDSVVVRTSPFTVLATYAPSSTLAFEIDDLDNSTRTGWSVLVRGKAEVVFDSRELEYVRRVWQPEPWADGSRNVHVRIWICDLTGRSVGVRPGVTSSR